MRELNLYNIRIKAMTLIPIDRKQTILEDAKERILKNHTLEQIAKSHGITKRTLNTWLMSLGDEYLELRQHCIDNLLAEALEEIDNATEHFPLARANSKWRAAIWYAERRDQQRYGSNKVNVNIGSNSVPTMSEALDEDLSALLAQIVKVE
jgi:AcrR family transcriptional regulator